MCYTTLEQWTRRQIRTQLQHLLEEEVTTFLGRVQHERPSSKSPVDPPIRDRNGYGKPQQFTMLNRTVTVRRPRICDLTDGFQSKVLPIFTW